MRKVDGRLNASSFLLTPYFFVPQGFKRDLDKIIRFFPDRQRVPRQTILFSATVSQSIKQSASEVLLSKYEYISTVTEEDDGTHAHVPQTCTILSQDHTLAALAHILAEEKSIHKNNYKVICFFPTGKMTQFSYELFSSMGVDCEAIHSKKSQNQRTKISEAFKVAKNGILFSSDVSARGVHYSNVTLVRREGTDDCHHDI